MVFDPEQDQNQVTNKEIEFEINQQSSAVLRAETLIKLRRLKLPWVKRWQWDARVNQPYPVPIDRFREEFIRYYSHLLDVQNPASHAQNLLQSSKWEATHQYWIDIQRKKEYETELKEIENQMAKAPSEREEERIKATYEKHNPPFWVRVENLQNTLDKLPQPVWSKTPILFEKLLEEFEPNVVLTLQPQGGKPRLRVLSEQEIVAKIQKKIDKNALATAMKWMHRFNQRSLTFVCYLDKNNEEPKPKLVVHQKNEL